MDRKLAELKRRYQEVPIPQELDFVVRKALKQSRKGRSHKKKWIVGVAASAVLLTTIVNTSPTVARTLADVPLLGSVIEVITFREYSVNEGTYQADLQVPAITNLENSDLAEQLNSKYLEENKQLYENFISEMEGMEEAGGGHLGIDSGYEIKTDNEQILSIGRYVVNTVGSSSTTLSYDTIDKKKEILITLPSLFKDAEYVQTISENIKQQMREQMQVDESKTYWVKDAGLEEEDLVGPFESITAEQNFYINTDGHLVISFDKYEVAPGYMGIVEFVIPTAVIADQLVSNEYIK